MEKRLSQWSEGMNIGIRKLQRYRKQIGVGTLTPGGYVLSSDEWKALLKVLPLSDARYKNKK